MKTQKLPEIAQGLYARMSAEGEGVKISVSKNL